MPAGKVYFPVRGVQRLRQLQGWFVCRREELHRHNVSPQLRKALVVNVLQAYLRSNVWVNSNRAF